MLQDEIRIDSLEFSKAKRVRLTQRRAMLIKARSIAAQKVADQIRPVFKKQYKILERFLRKGNLRKSLNKIVLEKGGEGSGENDGHPTIGKSDNFLKVEQLFKAPSAPEDPKDEQWDRWKKVLMLALLLGLFSATDDLAAIENEIWMSRGQEKLTYDAETLIEAYQYRTGRPLSDIGDKTLRDVQAMIAAWYLTGGSFPDLLKKLNKYFNEDRVELISIDQTSHLLAQMTLSSMQSYGFNHWYWDAMGEDPCHHELYIGGITYEGCADLNGRRFNRGDPMPPDASHLNCQCLPTPEEIDRSYVPPRTTPLDPQYPKPPVAGPLKQPRTRRFLGKGDFEGHPFRGNQYTGKYPTRIEVVKYPHYPYELKVDRNVVKGDPEDPKADFEGGYQDLYSIVPQRAWDDRSKPKTLWRSMSAYELSSIGEKREIQSTGSMSFHDQQGMTFYDDDPSRMYAEDNFKFKVIENHIRLKHPDFPTPKLGDVAYLVEVKTPSGIQQNQQGEYYTTEPLSASEITRVIEARPGTYNPKEKSFGFFGYRLVEKPF